MEKKRKKRKNTDGGELMLPAHIFKKKGQKSEFEVIDTERVNKIFPKEKKIETVIIADSDDSPEKDNGKLKRKRKSAKPKTEVVGNAESSKE